MEISPGTTIDRYRVDSILGSGGMAQVYKVHHQTLGSTHALKVLTTPSVAVRDRLLQEGRAQAQLRHQNVVNVTDVVDIDGTPGLVMEYISGPTLTRLLKAYNDGEFDGRYLPLPLADVMGRALISGVAAAHDHGLVHRDLKPSNILLEITESEVVPKVADFGLVKVISGDAATDASMTRSGMALGTPAYMAPEQVRDAKTMDHRGDLFALGAILYELLTGRHAFPGEDMMEIFTSVVNADYRPPDALRPDIPERMQTAIQRALTVDIDQRVQSCKELLDLWCGGEGRDFPFESQELRWSGHTLAQVAALGAGKPIDPAIYSQETASESFTWSGPAPDVQADMDGRQLGTETQVRRAPPPVSGVQPGTAAPLDGTLSREVQAPTDSALKAGKPATSASVLVLGAVVTLLGAGWWWMERQQPDAPASRGKISAPIPPAQKALPAAPGPVDATPMPVEIEEPASEEEPEPEPPEEEREREDPTPPEETPPPTAETPPPAAEMPAAPQTRFSFSGDVEKVFLRGRTGFFSAGKVPPGTYQVWIRVDGKTKKVRTVTLKEGDHLHLKCNPLGCK